MSATMNSPWPPWMLEPGPWWPWPPQGLLPLPVPVMLGGTGVTTVAGARESLGIDAAIQAAIAALPPGQSITLPLGIAEGGTGATTAPAARTALGVTLPLPIANGGTGATTILDAVTALGGPYVSLFGGSPMQGKLSTPAIDIIDSTLGIRITLSDTTLSTDSAVAVDFFGQVTLHGPLFVTDGVTLQPVSIGAADTGDLGFRVLQIPN